MEQLRAQIAAQQTIIEAQKAQIERLSMNWQQLHDFLGELYEWILDADSQRRRAYVAIKAAATMLGAVERDCEATMHPPKPPAFAAVDQIVPVLVDLDVPAAQHAQQ